MATETGKAARRRFGNKTQIKRAIRRGPHTRTGWKASQAHRGDPAARAEYLQIKAEALSKRRKK